MLGDVPRSGVRGLGNSSQVQCRQWAEGPGQAGGEKTLFPRAAVGCLSVCRPW